MNWLNEYLNNNEDYGQVKLTKEQHEYIDEKCKGLDYEETEVELNRYLFELGYTWNDFEDYKYRSLTQ